MPRATLPAQAVPEQLRPPPIPDPFEEILPSGLMVTWRMPDPFSIIAFDGVIPDPITAAVIALLKDEKQYTPESDPKKFRYDQQSIKGMYGLAAAMLESPKLDPNREYGDGDGTLGRREIGYLDVCQLYWLFRAGTRLPPLDTPDPAEPERPADAPPDRDGIRDDAGATAGDH